MWCRAVCRAACAAPARHQVQHGVAFASTWNEVDFADAAVEGFSSRGNVGRARRGSRSWSSAAASDPALVSAPGRRLLVSLFQTLGSTCHLDGLHLRSRRILQLCSTAAYSLDAPGELCAMDRMRACVLVALHARFLRDCFFVGRRSVPFMVSKYMCHTFRTCALCVEMSTVP